MKDYDFTLSRVLSDEQIEALRKEAEPNVETTDVDSVEVTESNITTLCGVPVVTNFDSEDD